MLLAGGGGRRAGVDKRFLVLEGQSLLQRNLAFLHGLFETVVVSLGQGQRLDLGDAATLGETEILTDAWAGSSPMAGIATALERWRTSLFVLAVDVAFPDRAACASVLAALPGHDLALPAIDRHYQPLFAAYAPSCLPVMTELLEIGRHSLLDVLPRDARGGAAVRKRRALRQHQHDGRLRRRPSARERTGRGRARRRRRPAPPRPS